MTHARPRTYETLGILLKFHAFPEEVLDKYCLVEATVPPGLGAPPNHHAGETEGFYIVEGEVEFLINGETQLARRGSHVPIPDGAVHAFTARGDSPARMLILNSPGHMHVRFFTELGKAVADDTVEPAALDGPPDVAAVASVAQAVGMTILPAAESCGDLE